MSNGVLWRHASEAGEIPGPSVMIVASDTHPYRTRIFHRRFAAWTRDTTRNDGAWTIHVLRSIVVFLWPEEANRRQRERIHSPEIIREDGVGVTPFFLRMYPVLYARFLSCGKR